MKIRNGFVSNSSSSSFIVAVKKGEKCPSCGRGDPNFLDLVEQIGVRADYEETGLRTRGAQEIQNRWKSGGFHSDDEWSSKEYKNILNLIKEAENKGYEVAEITISNHDSATNDLMMELRERKSLVVLWSDVEDIKNVKL